jgi:predicted esterase
MSHKRLWVQGFVLSAATVAAVVACGGEGPSEAATPTDMEAGANAEASANAEANAGAEPTADANADADAGSGPADAAIAIDPSVIEGASCGAAVPAGATRSAALPVYAGACPTLAVGPAATTIASGGAQRSFLVFRPTTLVPGETLPVVFLWHWLGGSADAMGSTLAVQAAVDARRFIGVVPSAKGDVLFRWPFEASEPQSRVDEEASFFDDMLACVGAALPVNKECVASIGVSAGALWTDQLATLRSQHLSSIVSLSGGTGGVARGWTTTPHRLPAMVLWGGSSDVYPTNIPIMNFQNASRNLIDALTNDGHYLVECTHNCGHAVPPFDPPDAGGLRFDPIWRFVLDHPFWLPPAKSPYAGKPLPPAYPSWCGQGKGSAVPRPSGATCL